MAPFAIFSSILGFAGKNFAKIVVGAATGASNVLVNGAKKIASTMWSLLNPFALIGNG